jgi:hypothetical protein
MTGFSVALSPYVPSSGTVVTLDGSELPKAPPFERRFQGFSPLGDEMLKRLRKQLQSHE